MRRLTRTAASLNKRGEKLPHKKEGKGKGKGKGKERNGHANKEFGVSWRSNPKVVMGWDDHDPWTFWCQLDS